MINVINGFAVSVLLVYFIRLMKCYRKDEGGLGAIKEFNRVCAEERSRRMPER